MCRIFSTRVCVATVGRVLDSLEAPHDDVVEKVEPASEPIPAFVMIEGITTFEPQSFTIV